MVDFQPNKITIFPGINDVPVSPTSTTGSNISHMHYEHNKLVDNIIDLQQQLDDDSQALETEITEIKGLIYPDVEATETNFDILQTTITNLQNTITNLENRLTTLENSGGNSTPTEDEFYFDSITVSGGLAATIGTITKTGTITKIQFHDFDNAFLGEFNTYFSNETTRDVFTNDTITEIDFDGYTGYEFTFTDGEVTSGDSLAIEDTDGNDGYDIEVKVFVLG